jgi:hypothetical protein
MYCETCKWRSEGGYCENNEKILEGDHWEKNKEDQLVYSYQEGGSFWVGPKFGCVHHENRTL